MKVILSDEAAAQVRDIDAWWRENRAGAADLFVSELEQAVSELSSTPTLGTKYEVRPGVRRLLLRRTHFHLYFVRRDERTSSRCGVHIAVRVRRCSAALTKWGQGRRSSRTRESPRRATDGDRCPCVRSSRAVRDDLEPSSDDASRPACR